MWMAYERTIPGFLGAYSVKSKNTRVYVQKYTSHFHIFVEVVY